MICPPTSRLDGNGEHLARHQFLHFIDQLPAPAVGMVAVHDQSQGIDPLAVDQHIQLDEARYRETNKAVVQRAEARG